MRRAALALAAAGLLAAGAAGCGTPSPDLFVVSRTGSVPGAKLELLVSDQSARCNGAPARPLTSAQIIEARGILRDLLEAQTSKVAVTPDAPAQIFSFAVTTEEGTLRFADTAQRPAVLPELARFTRRVAIDTCGLRR